MIMPDCLRPGPTKSALWPELRPYTSGQRPRLAFRNSKGTERESWTDRCREPRCVAGQFTSAVFHFLAIIVAACPPGAQGAAPLSARFQLVRILDGFQQPHSPTDTAPNGFDDIHPPSAKKESAGYARPLNRFRTPPPRKTVSRPARRPTRSGALRLIRVRRHDAVSPDPNERTGLEMKYSMPTERTLTKFDFESGFR